VALLMREIPEGFTSYLPSKKEIEKKKKERRSPAQACGTIMRIYGSDLRIVTDTL
jgi:hypothetical protein